MVGCDNPQYPDPEGERGTLSLSGFTITATDTTLTQGEDSIDVSNFVINIKNNVTEEIVASWLYGNIPTEVSLLEGIYIVEALNSEVQPAAWDAPYYYASTSVRIYGDEETTISSLQCTLANVKVSVTYSDTFKAAMSDDVIVSVTMAQGTTLNFTPDETRSGYFEYTDGSTTLLATLTGTVDGVETMNYQVLTGVTAGQHYTISFSLADEE